ncbi:MAG: hypothetical protein M0C28_44875 [Candidatus Moduliflexus flocculans]|nr:hypothetical protein [Candidatus Moduliflexus flocculans]
MRFAEAKAAAERAGLKEWIWQAIMGAARVAEAWGAKDEAIAKYDEAVVFLEGWLPDLAVGIYRIDFLDEKMEVFEALIRLLLERHRLAPREGWDEKAFEYAERSKGLDRLFRVEAGGGAGAPGRRDLTAAGAGRSPHFRSPFRIRTSLPGIRKGSSRSSKTRKKNTTPP